MPTPPVVPDLELLRRIGGGSYGEVWLARTLTGVYRAVKIVDRARFPDDRPFLRELDGITRFQKSVGDQPRQLALMHVGRIDAEGILYYVMELADDVVAGTEIDPLRYTPLTIKALHERRPVLPATEVIRLGVELARSLDGLHRAGLIHRDIKPSNIIFVAGVPKLADIGLVSSSDHTLTSIGTPGYSPPEGAGTVRADIYGLGRILYELVTGLPTGDFPRLPSDLEERTDVAPLLELNEVILRACAPNPADRYASAQEMLDDLLLLQAGKSVKELLHVRERVKLLLRFGVALGAAALFVVALLGMQNYLNLQKLAAQETAARQQAEQAERLARYSADLHLAQLALARGDLGLARAALRRQIPDNGAADLRGIEWRALQNETAGDQVRRLGEVGGPPVRALALSPDGQLLAAQEGELSRVTVVWDLASNTRRVLANDTLGLGGFTAGGAQLIVGTADGHLRLIDVATGAAAPVQAVEGRLLAHAGDGRTVLLGESVAGAVRFRVWDAVAQNQRASWEMPAQGSGVAVSAATLSADGRSLAACLFWSEGTIRTRELVVLNPATGAVQFRTRAIDHVRALEFSADGSLVAAAMGGEAIAVFESATGRRTAMLSGHHGSVVGLAFAPDNRALVSCGLDQTVRTWSLSTSQATHVQRGHEAPLTALIRDPNSSLLVSASEDGTIRWWNENGPPPRARLISGFWNSVLGDLAFSPDGQTLAVTDAAGRVALLAPRTGAIQSVVSAAFQPVRFSDDGATLFAITNRLELARIELATGAVTLTGVTAGTHTEALASAASPGRSFLALGFDDGSTQVWDCTAPAVLGTARWHEKSVWAVAVARDASVAASADMAGMVAIWDPRTGALRHRLPAQPQAITSLGFDGAGRFLAVGKSDGSISIWDVANNREFAALDGHTRPVYFVGFTSEGRRLLSGGGDALIASWSVADAFRKLTMLPLGPPGEESSDLGVYRIAMATDQTKMAVLTEDGHVRLLDVE